MRTRLVAALVAMVATGSLFVGAAPAPAARPPGDARTCPGPYESITLAGLIELANANGVPEERARAIFAKVNKNGDDVICIKPLPGDEPRYGFTDNHAVSQPK